LEDRAREKNTKLSQSVSKRFVLFLLKKNKMKEKIFKIGRFERKARDLFSQWQEKEELFNFFDIVKVFSV